METDELQAQLSHLQQLIGDEEQKRHRQKVPHFLPLFELPGRSGGGGVGRTNPTPQLFY